MANNPWKIRRGIYELIDDSFANRRKLENHLTLKFKKDGFKPKAILYGKDKVPQRISTASQKNVLKDPKNNKLKIKVSNPESLRGSDMSQQISKNATEGFRKQDIERGKEALQSRSRIGSIAENVGKIEAHHTRMLQMYRPFFEGLPTKDRAALADFAFKSKYALGNDISNRALLSEPFHDQIHKFMREMGYQVSSKKIKAGYKYPGVPDLGNTLESRKNALTHFFKNVQEPIERKLNTIKWAQEDVIKPLTKKEVEYASSWLDDKILTRELKAPKPDVTEVGKRLGGIGDTLKIGSKARWLIPAVGGAGALLSGMDAKARHQKAEETGNWVDKLQSGIAKAEFAADTAGAVPGPHSIVAEPVGLGAGLSNLTIDAIRGSTPNHKMDPKDRLKAINRIKYIK